MSPRQPLQNLSATVRRAGAEAEAGVRRGWQAAQLSRGKVCCLSIFCLASNDAVVHENDPRPQARAHRGLRIRPRRMLGCMRSMWASFLMPWPMPMQHAVLCARAWSARELRSCSSLAAKKPGQQHRQRIGAHSRMQSFSHIMPYNFLYARCMACNMAEFEACRTRGSAHFFQRNWRAPSWLCQALRAENKAAHYSAPLHGHCNIYVLSSKGNLTGDF